MKILPNAQTETTAPKVDDAVGVPKNYWFVAIVGNKTERQCAKKLERLGYECYVPTQEEIHEWQNGVRKIVERIIIPAVVFLHTTDAERKQSIVKLPYINRFMTNLAGTKDKFGRHPVAVIPDNQIQRLRYILGNADSPVEFEHMSFRLGDKVRVIRGGLITMEGYIVECMDKTDAYFTIRVDCLGVAKVRVKREDLELIKE